MHLKQLKLSGFKSFVDPTVIPFPSQLVAVVGPNGCGKSNVIDAVRWVLGESSAKNLRGESMTDVIFNGSAQRKSVGQASVELVFDNSMSRITGQYSTYQEVVVKRVVSRDGESAYYLNGTRCRRRDITDVFLGTGAGARGYSIIGQGTISRIVEAKPEELRQYLEEAAGISKYKERRKETLSRIQQTKDNLLRVEDIREELGKQLQRLERQAKTAEKYRLLVEEEKQCRAELLALKWRIIHEEQALKQQELQALNVQYENHKAQSAALWLSLTQQREFYTHKDNAYQDTQTQFYQLSTEIARLEENRLQQQREKSRLQIDQQQLQTDWEQIDRQWTIDTETLDNSKQNLALLSGKIAQLKASLTVYKEHYEEKLTVQRTWQENMNQVQQLHSKGLRDTQIAEIKIEQLSQRYDELSRRLGQLREDLQQLEHTNLGPQLDDLKASHQEYMQQLEALEHMYQNQLCELDGYRCHRQEYAAKCEEEKQALYQLEIQKASLLAQLKAHHRVADDSEIEWLKDKKQIVEILKVEKEWQYCCELILGASLNSWLLAPEELTQALSGHHKIAGEFVTFKTKIAKTDKPRLADKICSSLPHFTIDLEKILAASSLEVALAWLGDLGEDESIVTPDGYWLSTHWIRIPPLFTEQKEESLFLKQEKLQDLDKQIQCCEQKMILAQNEQLSAQQKMAQIEAQIEETKATRQLCQDKQRQLHYEIEAQQRQHQQLRHAQEKYYQEQSYLQQQLEEALIGKEEALVRLEALKQQVQLYAQEQQSLHQHRPIWEAELQQAKDDVEKLRQEHHQLELQQGREEELAKRLEDTTKRDKNRQEIIHQRLMEIAQRLLSLSSNEEQEMMLKEKLNRHQQLEQELQELRLEVENLKKQIEQCEMSHQVEERKTQHIQEAIQQTELQVQTLKVKAEHIIENLQVYERSLPSLLEQLAIDGSSETHEQHLQEIVDKISRLGAINLAAIEEYEHEAQRKIYLDEQFADLTEALETLESAIENMDKETRQRLQMTFDEVNQAFQALFPRLFGGGRAFLELTSDNLLEAGVVVMAQPPGKKNSTIYLLSGGEKAMTAVALVFAIFQLNPSPFCMLDEVDAPLDDANVVRFCTLVKEMSQFVQFFFITHNKITMELADHLIGVTMKEPGVSRVVAVDVEQAITMVE